MIWLMLTIISCLFVEILARLPVEKSIRIISDIGKKSSAILTSKHISDTWKEKAFSAYSGKLLWQTILLSGYFVIDFLTIGLIIFIFQQLQFEINSLILSLKGIIFTSVVATFYFLARQYFAKRSL
ncbi:MAG: hypothetical protein H6912_04700 [Kordiimonadaceae bacterium]|nr:hypothetical protein [Kordiimonadaceae bacterium]